MFFTIVDLCCMTAVRLSDFNIVKSGAGLRLSEAWMIRLSTRFTNRFCLGNVDTQSYCAVWPPNTDGPAN